MVLTVFVKNILWSLTQHKQIGATWYSTEDCGPAKVTSF